MVMYTLWSEESWSHPSYGLTSAFTYRLLWLHLPQVSKRLRKFLCVSPGHFSFGINIINFCRRKLGGICSGTRPEPTRTEATWLDLTWLDRTLARLVYVLLIKITHRTSTMQATPERLRQRDKREREWEWDCETEREQRIKNLAIQSFSSNEVCANLEPDIMEKV